MSSKSTQKESSFLTFFKARSTRTHATLILSIIAITGLLICGTLGLFGVIAFIGGIVSAAVFLGIGIIGFIGGAIYLVKRPLDTWYADPASTSSSTSPSASPLGQTSGCAPLNDEQPPPPTPHEKPYGQGSSMTIEQPTEPTDTPRHNV